VRGDPSLAGDGFVERSKEARLSSEHDSTAFITYASNESSTSTKTGLSLLKLSSSSSSIPRALITASRSDGSTESSIIDDTEPVFTDVGTVEISLRPPVDAGDEGIAVDARFWGELQYEMGVPPEIVRVCEREGRGTVPEPILCKAEGDGYTGEFTLGGELGSAITW